MKVHNLMEEYVSQRVDSMYEHMKGKNKPVWLTCDCKRCRMDSTAYVLNKVHPCYIVSGRGAVYSEQNLVDSQLKADVDALILEAIRTVSSTQRPNHDIMTYVDEQSAGKADGPAFNFPFINGVVLNGSTFEPLPNAEITLFDESGIVDMQDSSFPNPCRTFQSTKGSYTFWPFSIPAQKAGETKTFHFIVEAKAEGFSPVQTAFDVPVISDSRKRFQFSSILSVKVKDLILFRS